MTRALNSQQKDLLVKAALQARNRSYCFISGFAVGAALMGADGRMFVGCNIECSGQTPSVCAERVALFKAVSEGCTEFVGLAIAGGPVGKKPEDYCPPCGVCRQVLAQFCEPELPILIAKSDLQIQSYTLAELFPMPFVRKPE